MKRMLILAFMAVTMLGSCSKDETTPEKTIVGAWEGDRAQLIIYNEDGTEVATELNVSLQSPNMAKAVFNEDKTFNVDVKLVEPLPITEQREGTYTIEGANLVLDIEGEGPLNAPFILNEDELKVTLGTQGVSVLIYTFKRQAETTAQ